MGAGVRREHLTPLHPERGPDSVQSSQYPEERPFREVAQRLPGFGGWFFDTVSGNLVVYLTDLEEADSAKALIMSRFSRRLSERRRTYPEAGVVVRKADYAWLQLSEWRDLGGFGG